MRATREGACCMPGRGRTLRAYSHGREYTWRSHGHAEGTVQMGAIALVQMYHGVLMRVVAMQVRRSVHVADAATRRSCSRACEHGGGGGATMGCVAIAMCTWGCAEHCVVLAVSGVYVPVTRGAISA